MEILNTKAKANGNVSLSRERWNHIVQRHPEMSGYLDQLEKVLTSLDIIIESINDNSVWLYHREKDKVFMVVVVNITKEFIITAYITDKIKRGRVKQALSSHRTDEER